jgi:hypothetical protein
MSDWRITINEQDNTETVDLSFPILAATTIESPKGPQTWQLIEKGSTQKILDTYGYPSKDYPSIQDVLDFNNKCAVYVAAPYKTGTYGGVFITKEGTIPFVNGTSTKTITDYSAIAATAPLGVGNGIVTVFTLTLPNFKYYTAESIDILVNGTSIHVTAVGDPVETLTTTPDVGGGTYTLATGVVSFTFDSAPILDDVVTVSYVYNIEDIVYATLYSHDQQVDDLKVLVMENDTNPDTFTMYVQRYDPVAASYLDLSSSPFYFGLSPDSKDGYGNNIYIETIFGDEQVLFTPTVQNETFSTLVDDTVAVSLVGGNRGADITGTDLAAPYDDLKDTNKYPVSLIFDTTSETSVATKFNSLRTGELKYTSFVLPTADLTAAAIIANPTTAKNSIDNRGVFYYCLTWGIHTDIYQGKNFNCSNMGLIAGKIVDCMILNPASQPAYLDENGTGGQLGSGITKLNKAVEDSQLSLLDKARLNPVVIDPQYGPMLVGWRTTQIRESVYSYIAQSVQADMIINQVTNLVLTQQKGKPNDDYHRSQVKSKTDTILSNYSRGLDAFFTKCDRQNNTDAILNQQKFILSVAVRFISYASTITFNFITTPFGVDIEEAVK